MSSSQAPRGRYIRARGGQFLLTSAAPRSVEDELLLFRIEVEEREAAAAKAKADAEVCVPCLPGFTAGGRVGPGRATRGMAYTRHVHYLFAKDGSGSAKPFFSGALLSRRVGEVLSHAHSLPRRVGGPMAIRPGSGCSRRELPSWRGSWSWSGTAAPPRPWCVSVRRIVRVRGFFGLLFCPAFCAPRSARLFVWVTCTLPLRA